jgi:hypothetical protein
VVTFKEKRAPSRVCTKTFSAEEALQMRHAVEHEFWYQIFLDDLPLWAMVGEGQPGNPFVFTHSKLDIGYNGDRVIEVNLTAENAQAIQSGKPTEFTYEVSERGCPPGILSGRACTRGAAGLIRQGEVSFFFLLISDSLFRSTGCWCRSPFRGGSSGICGTTFWSRTFTGFRW